MPSWEFPTSAPIDLTVSTLTGSVTITAEHTDVVTVIASSKRGQNDHFALADDDDLAGDLTVDFTDGHLDIEQPSQHGLHLRSHDIHLQITVPTQSHCTVRTMAAGVSCEGEVGSLDVKTASGRVAAGSVTGPVNATTMSGQIRLASIAGEAFLNTASGQIQVGHAAGDLSAATASGEVIIGTAGGSVNVKTASGRVRIGCVARGRTDVNTVSGDVEIKVSPGTGVYLDLASVTGRVSSELEPTGEGDDSQLHLRGRTVTGALNVARATSAEMAS
jgi:DUF4097 and DUF4098 domain-containing protein YvlB